jgi:hypothetical protein
MTMSQELICKNCKFFELWGEPAVHTRCTHPSNAIELPSVNLVTGERITGRYSQPPHVLRSYGWLDSFLGHACGKQGRWYIPISNTDY